MNKAMTDGEQRLANEAMRLREALYNIAHRNKTKASMKETALRTLYRRNADNAELAGTEGTMVRWTTEEALKWADTWGAVEDVAPSGDQMALDALAREVRALRAGLERLARMYEDQQEPCERPQWVRDLLPDNAAQKER